MADPIEPTPEEVMAAYELQQTKDQTRAAMISHMNGVGASILQQYPTIEVMSWPIQRPEAVAVLALGGDVLALDEAGARAIAPYLMDVCEEHFGPAETDHARMVQLQEKAQIVAGLSVMLLTVTAKVNGIRARMDDRLAAAASHSEVYVIKSEVSGELGALYSLYGL